MKYYENWQTGEILAFEDKYTLEDFSFNPRHWDEISEERYNQLLALKSVNWKVE